MNFQGVSSGWVIVLPQSERSLSTETAGLALWKEHGEALGTVACGLLVLSGWLVARSGQAIPLATALFLAGYVLGGYRQALQRVLTLIKDRELDVDPLIVVATIGAAAIGIWLDGALLIFIFALNLSGTVEGCAGARTERDIKALMDLNPAEALVIRHGKEQRVATSSLHVGDTVLVKPGERIPADGRVTEGISTVNQASTRTG